MDVPNLLFGLFYEYRWFLLAPAIMLAIVILLRGENRFAMAFVLVIGGLLYFRDHNLVRSLISGLNQLLRHLGQLLP